MTFDLDKARDLATNPIHCPETDEIFADAITEIERLRAKVGKMEFLMRSTDDTCLACAIKLEVVDQQAARIQELEEALIDSSDHIGEPNKLIWQITDERKAALKRLYGLLVIRYKYSYPDETEVLWAMLREAGQ